MSSSSRPLFLFAPGAGAPTSSRWMVAWRQRLATLGDVVAFDYPYMLAGRRSPDRPPALIAAHREELARAVTGAAGPRRVFLIGKSMGGRMGCHLATDDPGHPIAGLVCFGYPLRSASSGALRDQVLLALRTPILFVQGTRDPLCALDELDAVRARMTAPNRLYVVEGGDHSLEVTATQRKASGQSQADIDARVLQEIAGFVGTSGGA